MRKYNLTVNNNEYEVIVKEATMDTATVEVNGVEHIVSINEIRNIATQDFMPTAEELRPKLSAAPPTPAPRPQTPVAAPADGGKSINAPIPGQVKGIFIKAGDAISTGQKVLVMEAMKMENVITATFDGTVSQILVSEGDSVNQDQQLVVFQ